MKQQLNKLFNQIETKHRAELLLAIIIIGFVAIESPELNQKETYPDYFDHVVPYLDQCRLLEVPSRDGINKETGERNPDMKPTRSPLKWWSLCLSDKAFGNERVIPFLFSIALIPITYSFVNHLTHRKVASLIAVLVLVSSGTFTEFDTTATYEQSWVVFLMLSLILIQRGSALGVMVFFVLAVLSKPMSIIYLPVLFAFAIPQRNPMVIGGLSVLTLLGIAVVLSDSVGQIGGAFEFNLDELLHGFYNWWFYLNASLLVAMTLPLVMWKLFSNRKKVAQAKPVLLALLIIIVSVPIIDGFTNQLNHSYRFVPMIIFAGIGIAIIVTNFAMYETKPLQKINDI